MDKEEFKREVRIIKLKKLIMDKKIEQLDERLVQIEETLNTLEKVADYLE